MNDLTDEERSLFAAARAGYEPKDEQRKEVLAGVLLRAGVVAGMTSTATSAAAAAGTAGAPLAGAASGLVGLAWKVTLWMAIGGSIGIGGYAIFGSRAHSTPSSAQVHAGTSTLNSAATRPMLPSPGALPAAPSLEPPSPQDSPKAANQAGAREAGALHGRAPTAAVSVSSVAPHDSAAHSAISAHAPAVAAFPSDGSHAPAAGSTAAPSAAPGALSVEARALAKVQSALKEGRNAEALQLVEQQRQQFAHGELQQERDAARIVALCAVGRVAEARSAAMDFLSSSPRSPFAARIQSSCAGGQ